MTMWLEFGSRKRSACIVLYGYKSNLKTTLELKGSTNFDNFWKKKITFEKKLKNI
jgi:hypothetical protein